MSSRDARSTRATMHETRSMHARDTLPGARRTKRRARNLHVFLRIRDHERFAHRRTRARIRFNARSRESIFDAPRRRSHRAPRVRFHHRASCASARAVVHADIRKNFFVQRSNFILRASSKRIVEGSNRANRSNRCDSIRAMKRSVRDRACSSGDR